jgi:hypothetical protein
MVNFFPLNEDEPSKEKLVLLSVFDLILIDRIFCWDKLSWSSMKDVYFSIFHGTKDLEVLFKSEWLKSDESF